MIHPHITPEAFFRWIKSRGLSWTWQNLLPWFPLHFACSFSSCGTHSSPYAPQTHLPTHPPAHHRPAPFVYGRRSRSLYWCLRKVNGEGEWVPHDESEHAKRSGNQGSRFCQVQLKPLLLDRKSVV